MKNKFMSTVLYLMIISIAFLSGLYTKGLMAYTHTKSENINNNRQQLMENVLNREKNLYKSYEAEINQLRSEIESLKNNKIVDNALEQEYKRAKELAGMTEVRGKGIIIYISEKNAEVQISADNLLEYLNIIKYAGAKAISINNQRIVATTGIYQAGPNMLVNKVPINSIGDYDYVIKAIGDPDQLYSFARVTNGLYDYLASLKINVKIEKSDDIIIPAYNGSTIIKYSKSID